MPRAEAAQPTNIQRVKAIVRERKLSYDVAYLLMADALKADGIQPSKVLPNPPVEASLSQDDRSALASARSSLGIGG